VGKGSKIRYLEVDELLELVDSMSSSRDRLIVLLLYETGCTITELVGIKKRDVKDQTIIIEDSVRTNEKRTVRISKELLRTIKKFLKENNTKSDFLLSTRQSDFMTQKRIQQIISQYETKEGEKITPQVLRYTHIAHAYAKGVGISEIVKQVGLRRSRTIEIFSLLKSETDNYNKFLSQNPINGR
jgi:site-specific recombinase XerD